MKWFWGDLHNHCAVSYGRGLPEQALAHARQHLDFCTITGHAFWPDMPMDLASQNAIVGMHLGGFAKLQHFWPHLLKCLENSNQPGEFVTFPSYEWHSMRYGDHNCYAPDTHLPLIDGSSPEDLERRLRQAQVDPIILPHHIGYALGYRGLDWESFDARRSPLVEVYSNHGGGESDRSPFPYYHNMGPRFDSSMALEGLMRGHRFGFYASTDSHDGYPGHYGHGRVGVLAERLDRASIWEALSDRRTIAFTGANIGVDFRLGDAGIGQSTRHAKHMPLHLDIEAADAIDRVTLIEGTDGGWREHPLKTPDRSSHFKPGRYLVKIEMGWGRKGVRSSWEGLARIRNGRLLDATPYFRFSGIVGEERSLDNTLGVPNDGEVAWKCHALSTPAGHMGGTHFDTGGTQSVLLKIDADDRTEIEVETGGGGVSTPLSALAGRSTGFHVGGFASPALKVHRAVPENEFRMTHEMDWTPDGPGFCYLRIQQNDGQSAWVSPIWLD